MVPYRTMVEAIEGETKSIRELDQLTNLAGNLFIDSFHSPEFPYFLLTASEDAVSYFYPKDKIGGGIPPWLPFKLAYQSNLDVGYAEAFRRFDEYGDVNYQEFAREFCADLVYEVLRKNSDLDSEDQRRIDEYIRNN